MTAHINRQTQCEQSLKDHSRNAAELTGFRLAAVRFRYTGYLTGLLHDLGKGTERFNAYNGATFGLKPTLKQSNYYRPHNKFSAAENLYFCGSSTHPGAGVPIVMQSAKLAVEELLRDDNH